MGLDIRPGPLLTDSMTLGKLLNLSEASASSSMKVPDEKKVFNKMVAIVNTIVVI